MKAEDEIQKKLLDLEKTLKEAQPGTTPARLKTSAQLMNPEDEKQSMKSDMQMLAGCSLIGVGVLMVLNHIKIGTGVMSMLGFGGGGAGFLILPIIIGIGVMFYDYKNKWGWLLTGGGFVVLLFVLLSQLTMYFAHISMLGFILMFLPLAIGGAMLAKGMKIRNQLDDKAKQS